MRMRLLWIGRRVALFIALCALSKTLTVLRIALRVLRIALWIMWIASRAWLSASPSAKTSRLP